MKRRTMLQMGIGTLFASPLLAAVRQNKLDAAAEILAKATDAGQVRAAAMCVRQGDQEFSKSFGAAKTPDAQFLLASISKPMAIAAVMTLYDQGEFRLEDPASKFIPEFTGEGREKITIQQLMTHTCGLPDQLPENGTLRRQHAPLSEFIRKAIHTPLRFRPGTEYRYSSMGILLACEVAQRISGQNILKFMDPAIFEPLQMRRSALGLGKFKLAETMQCQIENAAPESGAGDAAAKSWDWNSPYWRKFGAPWGGVHTTAPDVARFFAEFLHPQGLALKPETSRLMVRNHNAAGQNPRGLGFDVGTTCGGAGCSPKTFGHGGSTGTLAWADPATDTICVVLTTLPARALKPHPRVLVSDRIAQRDS